ncbi:MAG: hypothetical protein HW405_47, partial [Candidatus Berkelbacteria bacterium]|nr:hypothetical protein [Candidatus Berkelbacteria bacterium]
MNSSQNPQGQEIGRGKVSLRGKLSKEGFDRQQLDNIEKLGNKPINVSDALKSKDSGRPKDKVPTNVKREPWPKRLFGSKKDSEDGAENNQAEGQPAQSSDNQKRDENQESEDHGEGQQEKANVEEQNQTQQDESQIQEQAEDQAQEEGQEAQHLKFTDRLKKQFSDFRKKQAENLKKKLSKEIIKKALLALVSNPYFWAAVAIFILILIIASSCSRQSGKTPYLSLERGKDDTLVLKFLAAAGEKGAQRELISKQAVATKDELKKINITDPEGKKIVDQINVLLDEIVTLADNTNAVQERVNKINELLNKLDQYVPKNSPSPGTPSTSPSTTQKSAIDVASAADAAPTPSTAANSALTSVRAKVNEMPKMISYYERGHLVVNPKDIDYARNYNLDRRVIQMLVYLVTPTDQSGAGHERIKVNRIKFSYDTERKSISKETDFADKEEPNISAHFSGQAADITEIDYIKCTEIKRRRLLKDKKRKLPPIPIKVAWQSEEGYAKTGGPEAFGQNMHELFKNLGTGAVNDLLIAEIADALGIELDPTKLKGMSLGEMTKYIGTAYLKSQLDIPGDYELGSDFNDIVTNIGRSYLAQAIGVPVEGIQGGTPDEITENVGRAILEQKLGLVAGSLAGNNSEEIFSSAGRRKIEDSLNISRSALAVSYSDAAGFQRAVGQGRVEKSLGIKPQTFFGTNLADLKKRLTKELFDVTFADPETIDNWLGIADGSTDNLISGKISPDAFNSIVGAKVIEKELNIYKAEDKRAEAFDVSVSDLQGMSVGNKSSFVGMGKYTIAKAFTASDPERELFISWFNSRTKPSNLDVDYLGGQRGLRPGDIDKIFISDLGNQVFRRLGKVEIINNLEDNPQIAQSLEPVKEIRFYTDRLNIIQDNFRALKNNASDNEIKAKAQESENIISGLLSDLSVKSIQDKTKQLQSNLKYIQDHSQKDDPRTQDRVKAIEKALAEIIEGRELNDFDSYSAGSITAKTDPQVGLTKKDVIAVLMGKKKLEDLVVNIGMAKWENELDLPAGTLTETYKGLKDSGLGSIDEILLISIGKTKVKEYGGANRGSADQVDRDLNISSGTTA